MRPPLGTIKNLLQHSQSWWTFYQTRDDIRPVEEENIVKLLSCGSIVRGSACYTCPTEGCQHIKHVCFTCKSRFCTSCGKKATMAWIAKQVETLPKTPWQHITFTMPDIFWPIFKANRWLLNSLSKLAADAVMKQCKGKNITPAVFGALHTFGRPVTWHPHMHISATTGGLHTSGDKWVSIKYNQTSLMKVWRRGIINLLREAYKSGALSLPDELESKYPDYWSFNKLLDEQYNRTWIVHLAKVTKDSNHSVKYLGRYIKRPPISMSRLLHYDGNVVIFEFLNHRTKKKEEVECSAHEFIERFIQHIPEKHFKLIRYYGVLANRVKGKLLPKVYELLNQKVKKVFKPRWAQLFNNENGIDPLQCILCKARLNLAFIWVGKSSKQLLSYHKELALAKPIYT